jgi:hypothetical protein
MDHLTERLKPNGQTLNVDARSALNPLLEERAPGSRAARGGSCALSCSVQVELQREKRLTTSPVSAVEKRTHEMRGLRHIVNYQNILYNINYIL